MRLDSNDRTLRDILRAYYFFIPRYQRPYSWTTENVDELWVDTIEETGAEYFIGSMVVHPVKRGSDTMAVIDGQQRLTTLMMMLCALRDAADRHGLTSLANGTHRFVEREDEDDNERFVLETETSHPFLKDAILSRGEPVLDPVIGREEETLQAGFSLIEKKVAGEVAEILDKQGGSLARRRQLLSKKLKSRRDKLLGLRLIFIEVGDVDDATTIFVTLNSRGRDLEPSDLVKAHLLFLMPKAGGLDRPRERWEAVQDLLDESPASLKMTDLLLAVWRSRYGSATNKNLMREVRKKIRRPQAPTFLAEVADDARFFRQANEPDFRKWRREQRDVRDSIKFLSDFGLTQPMPMLVALLRAFDARHIKLAQLRRAVRAIEDYHFQHNVMASKTSTGGMSSFYAARARLLLKEPAAKRADVIAAFIKSLNGRRPADAEFDEAFAAVVKPRDSRKRDDALTQYILRRHYQHHAPRAAVDFNRMTVEHLHPLRHATPWTPHLGNLIYVSEELNDQLGEKPFADKQKILKTITTEWIPPEILAATEWNDAAIEARTEALAEEARDKIWTGG